MICFTIPRTTLAVRDINNKVHISARRFCAPRNVGLLLVLLVFVLIQATIPAGATSPASAPKVRLVLDAIYPGDSYDGRWDISKLQKGEASIETESGKLTYRFSIPKTIEPGGSPCNLVATSKANKGQRLLATVDVFGEIDIESSGLQRISMVAESGETKMESLTITLKPRSYSEGSLPVVRVKLGGGQASLLVLCRYTVEQVSTGDTGGLSGSWRIVQTGDNGARYTGTLIIKQSGNLLSGRAEWENHTQGNISGEVQGRTIKFTVQYAGGLVGRYEAEVSSAGNQMLNGEARSNKGGGVVKWQASRVGGPA
jgi:hypothetical protein